MNADPFRSLGFVPVCITVVMLAACQAPPTPSGQPPTPAPSAATMHEHFALARDLVTFAMNGDLDRLHITARELSTLEESRGVPAGAEVYVDKVHAAARAAVAASTASDAAREVAEMARACGECHLAYGTDLGARFQDDPPSLSDPRGRHARYLSWVNRLLWDGLVGPSDRTWRIGANALADPDGFPPPDATYVPQDVVDRAAGALRNLGKDASATESADAQVRVLARVWLTCADCHTQAGIR
jgi:cytochrome c553